LLRSSLQILVLLDAGAMLTTETTAGERFARAFLAKDWDGVATLLDPQVDFRGLTPGRAWEASTAEDLIQQVLSKWIEPSDDIGDGREHPGGVRVLDVPTRGIGHLGERPGGQVPHRVERRARHLVGGVVGEGLARATLVIVLPIIGGRVFSLLVGLGARWSSTRATQCLRKLGQAQHKSSVL
jgi:hypothetical protein